MNKISKTFIICLTNLKLFVYYLANDDYDESKKYFKRAFNKINLNTEDFPLFSYLKNSSSISHFLASQTFNLTNENGDAITIDIAFNKYCIYQSSSFVLITHPFTKSSKISKSELYFQTLCIFRQAVILLNQMSLFESETSSLSFSKCKIFSNSHQFSPSNFIKTNVFSKSSIFSISSFFQILFFFLQAIFLLKQKIFQKMVFCQKAKVSRE